MSIDIVITLQEEVNIINNLPNMPNYKGFTVRLDLAQCFLTVYSYLMYLIIRVTL